MSVVHMILGPGFAFCGSQSFTLSTEWPKEVTCPKCKDAMPADYAPTEARHLQRRPQIGRPRTGQQGARTARQPSRRT